MLPNTEAEHLHAALCRALDGEPTPPTAPDCRQSVQTSPGTAHILWARVKRPSTGRSSDRLPTGPSMGLSGVAAAQLMSTPHALTGRLHRPRNSPSAQRSQTFAVTTRPHTLIRQLRESLVR